VIILELRRHRLCDPWRECEFTSEKEKWRSAFRKTVSLRDRHRIPFWEWEWRSQPPEKPQTARGVGGCRPPKPPNPTAQTPQSARRPSPFAVYVRLGVRAGRHTEVPRRPSRPQSKRARLSRRSPTSTPELSTDRPEAGGRVGATAIL
jgi:hypothetical protein